MFFCSQSKLDLKEYLFFRNTGNTGNTFKKMRVCVIFVTILHFQQKINIHFDDVFYANKLFWNVLVSNGYVSFVNL